MTILNWIKEYLESYKVEVNLVPNKNENKASLHCRIGPPKEGVILSGHMDVVPVEGKNGLQILLL